MLRLPVFVWYMQISYIKGNLIKKVSGCVLIPNTGDLEERAYKSVRVRAKARARWLALKLGLKLGLTLGFSLCIKGLGYQEARTLGLLKCIR